MKFSRTPNRALGVRPALHSCDQQAFSQRFEIKSAVEAVGKGTKVLLGVLFKAEAVVAATQACLEVAQHRVDPLQLRYILGFASCHDSAFVGAACLSHGTEAGQAIRIDGAASSQAFSGPICNSFELEAGYWVELEAQRVAILSEGDRSDKGHLVLGATSYLATNALTTQIGIVNLDFARERVVCFTLSHSLHQFVVYQPSRWIAHTQLAFESQRRQAGLGLADKINGQKPCRQRQFGRLKNSA